VTTSADTPVKRWEWNNDDPFGGNAPNENPAGAGTYTLNFRLPGQYSDTETGLNYNYWRDCYDPATGRYCQTDPIGLLGSINVYTYGENSPVLYVDAFGLFCISPEQAKIIAAFAGGSVTGAIVGRSISATLAGGTIGASIEALLQAAGFSQPTAGIVSGVAAGVATPNANARGRAVGALAGLLAGAAASTSENASNTTAGVVGVIGSFGAEVLIPDRPYTPTGAPLFRALRGGVGGIVGGGLQDTLEKLLPLAYPCVQACIGSSEAVR
jgi:RHS repeat-associated protein